MMVRPVMREVLAVQFNGTNAKDLIAQGRDKVLGVQGSQRLWVQTASGSVIAQVGDWILWDQDDFPMVCTGVAFPKQYQEIPSQGGGTL